VTVTPCRAHSPDELGESLLGDDGEQNDDDDAERRKDDRKAGDAVEQIEGQVGDLADKAAGGKKSVDTPAKAYRDRRQARRSKAIGIESSSTDAAAAPLRGSGSMDRFEPASSAFTPLPPLRFDHALPDTAQDRCCSANEQ
jgi:hypothetical protein